MDVHHQRTHDDPCSYCWSICLARKASKTQQTLLVRLRTRLRVRRLKAIKADTEERVTQAGIQLLRHILTEWTIYILSF